MPRCRNKESFNSFPKTERLCVGCKIDSTPAKHVYRQTFQKYRCNVWMWNYCEYKPDGGRTLARTKSNCAVCVWNIFLFQFDLFYSKIYRNKLTFFSVCNICLFSLWFYIVWYMYLLNCFVLIVFHCCCICCGDWCLCGLVSDDGRNVFVFAVSIRY